MWTRWSNDSVRAVAGGPFFRAFTIQYRISTATASPEKGRRSCLIYAMSTLTLGPIEARVEPVGLVVDVGILECRVARPLRHLCGPDTLHLRIRQGEERRVGKRLARSQ